MKNWTVKIFSTLLLSGIVASNIAIAMPASAKCCKTACKTNYSSTNGEQWGGKCQIMQGWENAVQLSGGQKQDVDQIHANYMPQEAKMKNDLISAENTLHNLMLNADSPMAQDSVYKQIEAVGAIKTQLKTLKTKEAFEIQALLNPDQQKISKAYWQDVFAQKERMMQQGADANMNGTTLQQTDSGNAQYMGGAANATTTTTTTVTTDTTPNTSTTTDSMNNTTTTEEKAPGSSVFKLWKKQPKTD